MTIAQLVRPATHLRHLAVLAAFLAGAVTVCASPGLAASPNASVQETIAVGVRAVTVTPSSIVTCPSAEPLTLPNGTCQSPAVTVTNGPVAGHIDVNGADAVPADGGTSWALCTYSSCTGPSSNGLNSPGVDQYSEDVGQFLNGLEYAQQLTTTPQCDPTWNVPAFGCSVSAGQSAQKVLNVTGPTSSSDQSPTFTTSVTWTAMP